MKTLILKFPQGAYFIKTPKNWEGLSHHDDGDAPSNVPDHSDGRLLFRDQHWKVTEIRRNFSVSCRILFWRWAPALTWYFHAGVNGSGGLDGGWGVAPVYLVRLCVLSLAVDHSDAQTQTLGKRLGPASKRRKVNMAAAKAPLVVNPRQCSVCQARRWSLRGPKGTCLSVCVFQLVRANTHTDPLTFLQKLEIWPQSRRFCSRGSGYSHRFNKITSSDRVRAATVILNDSKIKKNEITSLAELRVSQQWLSGFKWATAV